MPKNLRKRGRIWWYRLRKNGQDQEGSLDTESLTVARERLEEVRRRLTDRTFGLERHSFDAAARRFAAEHFKTLKRKSRLRYVASMTNLEAHMRGLDISTIDTAKLSEFEQARLSAGVTSSTVRRDLACLSSIFSRCEEWGWTRYNPVKPYLRSRKSALKEGAPRERYWTPEQEQTALPHAPERFRAMVVFAIDTGLRKEEQFSLLWSDVDLDAAQITIRAEVAKSSKSRQVPILPRTLEILKTMPRTLGYVWTTEAGSRYSPTSPSINDGLAKVCRRAGLERISWHDLRRSCGCRLLQDMGLRMEEVSRWLGHSSVKVTERHYAFLNVSHLHRALQRGADVVSLRNFKLNGQN